MHPCNGHSGGEGACLTGCLVRQQVQQYNSTAACFARVRTVAIKHSVVARKERALLFSHTETTRFPRTAHCRSAFGHCPPPLRLLCACACAHYNTHGPAYTAGLCAARPGPRPHLPDRHRRRTHRRARVCSPHGTAAAATATHHHRRCCCCHRCHIIDSRQQPCAYCIATDAAAAPVRHQWAALAQRIPSVEG